MLQGASDRLIYVSINPIISLFIPSSDSTMSPIYFARDFQLWIRIVRLSFETVVFYYGK